MQLVITFIPWIAYAVLVDTTSWTSALAVCLGLSLALLLRDLRSTGRVDVLSVGGMAFFTALLGPAVLGAPHGVQEWSGPAANAWIAVLMGLSLLVRRPFVAAAARSQAPEQAWDQPYFTTMVNRIAGLWAASYAVGSLLLAAATLWAVPGAADVVNVLQVLVPVLAMRRPIATAQAEGERLAAATGAATQPGVVARA